MGIKCYGSIPHLPGSRMGPGDHHCHKGQELICTTKVRDKHDKIIVQQKYDGSCVGVYREGDEIIPLGRAGYTAESSPYEQHKLFHNWAIERKQTFITVLEPGERLVGEWLAQAHGTRYDINTLFGPFIAFDIIRGTERLCFDVFIERIVCGHGWQTPPNILYTPQVVGYGAMSVEEAMEKVCNPWAKDPIEGVVYRVERMGKVDFLAKYVRPDKVDGSYLPEVSGKEAIWNWRP